MDDCSGETLGYTMERLLEAGARDVCYTPIFMKKNRPAYMITVLCSPDHRAQMEQILFRETSTIGIRRQWMERSVLKRENRVVETSMGAVQVKVVCGNGEQRFIPEYESIAALAREKGVPFRMLYQQVEREIATMER